MSHALRRTISIVLPLSLQRRRITQAVEMILSNLDLYATVTALFVDGSGGKRLVMELRCLVALPAPELNAMRRYVARKLDQMLGLRLRAEQIYLVSLPPGDAPAQPTPRTDELRRVIQSLPHWGDDSVPAANDSTLTDTQRLAAASERQRAGSAVVGRAQPGVWSNTHPVGNWAARPEAQAS